MACGTVERIENHQELPAQAERKKPKWEIPNNVSKKVSVINFKGGVGKTTLAFHLAALLFKPCG